MRHPLQMDIISLPNNTLVAAFNDSPDKRTPLRLATSTDGGVTWTRQALIENDPVGSFHYPALLYDPKNVSAAMKIASRPGSAFATDASVAEHDLMPLQLSSLTICATP